MTPEQHALALVVSERIEQLINYRLWYRRLLTESLRPYFTPMLAEWNAELRALLRLRRRARNIARQAEVARTAAVDAGAATWREMRREDLADEIELGMI